MALVEKVAVQIALFLVRVLPLVKAKQDAMDVNIVVSDIAKLHVTVIAMEAARGLHIRQDKFVNS